jgi:hypothetical protein
MLRVDDRQNLEIERFIFHPILKDADDHYFDEVELTAVQRTFFKNWFASALKQASEYEFVQKDADDCLLNKIIAIQANDNIALAFTNESKNITATFKRFHKASSSDGILALALTRIPSGRLFFLVKTTFGHVMQYKERLEQGRRKVTLSEIDNPISEDAAAIQKAVIINIDSNYDWEVLAQDRQSQIPYKIADYFKNFLHVREREVSSVLTRKVFSSVKNWVRDNKPRIDPAQTVSDYWGRAYDYLRTHDEFETDNFVAAVVVDPNEERRTELRTSLRTKLETDEIAGRAFAPSPGSITPREAKATIKTTSGVTINYIGTKEANSISIERQNNEQVITIRTPEITYS